MGDIDNGEVGEMSGEGDSKIKINQCESSLLKRLEAFGGGRKRAGDKASGEVVSCNEREVKGVRR